MSISSTYFALIVLAVFLSALVGAWLPVHLSSFPRVTRYGNAFAAGFLAAAAFVHLLPEAHAPLAAAFPAFPVDGLLALVGASAVFIFDNVARGHNCTKVSSSTSALAYVLAATLSFHSLVEGLTLGVSVSASRSFAAVAAAILAHKFFAALALGSSLVSAARVDSSTDAFRNVLYIGVAFACITPAGALLGALLVECLSRPLARTLTAALSCLSAGVFLYVAFVELLAEDFRERTVLGYDPIPPVVEDTGRRAAVFIFAASAMSVLAVWA